MKNRINLLFAAAFIVLVSFKPAIKKDDKLSLEYEQYQLKNGLDVILHQDKSDPIVAVAIQYHVGSNREEPGKTGFAHLFEHMMFQQSENVGQDQFFKKIQGAGGTLNGGTWTDGTIYYEVVPKNALELALWLESDRMGYLQNTVTESAFANQQNVVQNEKRQSYDNRPYGHNRSLIAKNLYPEGHPYSWTVIGEMEDLFAATIKDVKEFHSKFYVPNNSTLVIAGDFNTKEVKKMVEKYFGEIPAGNHVADPKPQVINLKETKKLYHEDNFARTPQLTMVWPVPQQYTQDAYALDLLARILSSNKKSPFYRVIVKDKKLAPRTSVYNSDMELAGQFTITINANAGTSLAEVEDAVFEAFELFEKEGVSAKDVEREKAGLETSFYNGISSVFGKSYQLALYNEYAGSPGFIEKDIENIRAVTADDVVRVYNKYIKNQPYLATSFVPKGKVDLIADGSENAGIVEEDITNATQVEQTVAEEDAEIEKTPSSFDRSVEPKPGQDPELKIPTVWEAKTSNGIEILGINQNEVPLVQYSLIIEGGHLQESFEKSGVASFLADMLTEGTANKTPEELEEAIDLLGASINVYGGTENIRVQVNSLARNFEETVKLVEEILLEPRWDEQQFELVKTKKLNQLERNYGNPNYLAAISFYKLIYGENNILSMSGAGTPETVENITLDDLKSFYKQNFSPTVTTMQVAGSVSKKQVMQAMESLSENWKPKNVELVEVEQPKQPEEGRLYFIDMPGAKQSVIYAGYASNPRNHPDYFPSTVMNYKLGGSFSGILNLILREEKGFTYGARSGFSGYKYHGNFNANSSVRSDATKESVQIFKDEMEKYIKGIEQDDLQFTKDALIKSNAREFETLGALLRMLRDISTYNLPIEYVKQEEEFIKNLTAEQHQQLAKKLIDPSKMIFVVVGDAETQMDQLEEIGLGKPVLYEL